MSDILGSWSRRRAAVAAEEQAEERAKETAAIAEQKAVLAEKSDEEILEELGLPNPESLMKGDDFKAFMAKSVPAHLRKRALRQLWRSDPVLACVDGLNDYDDDYLSQGIGQAALKTTYQVGKGLMAHLIELDRQEAAAAKTEETALVTEILPEQTEQASRYAPPLETQPAVDADEDAAPCIPRRMQFHFEEDAT